MNRRPPTPVPEEAAAAYARDGIVCLRGMFDAGWIEFMGEAVDRAMAAPGEIGRASCRERV